MDTKKSIEAAYGVVTEALPNTLFRVRLDGQENDILAYLGGKMRMNRIRVLVGDRVSVELDPYGGKGRIVKRM
ncbi:MAG: translation initiation factor IF-1 [Candidatus Pacebacteria bacterium]|nr:translation initiation factor IF-1 [Candidatus Paceibacterota bacterium]